VHYHWRALIEADICRWKRVIGDGLRSRTDRRQAQLPDFGFEEH
jgi:hypothetical protein